MCWEVLNDSWVSHPTWAAEDAAPFMAHKKNIYEEALHKSEEERHEYDYHIEANLRTITLLEPLNNKIQTMDPEERAHFSLKSGLGGHSKSIYQRIIKKVYGKELGPEVIRAMHDNPVAALPIVLERLKSKDEEWKKAQREWNRVWREQDSKNFAKALDHQGVAFKNNDKKTISAKSLVAEIEARRREFSNVRAAALAPTARPRAHFVFNFGDLDVMKDLIKLVISYLDRVNNSLSTADKDRIERQLRDFVPLFFQLDAADFDADFGDPDHPSEEQDSDESEDENSIDDEEARKVKKATNGDSLRKRLLKSVGQRANTATPGPEEDMSPEGTPMTDVGDRADTPLPVPADPEAVAEAVEKDKAGADAHEKTWVQIDIPSPPAEPVNVRRTKRNGNFFTNTHFYVLIRLLQVR
jgi:paired amphipathic helix protein Sin3a